VGGSRKKVVAQNSGTEGRCGTECGGIICVCIEWVGAEERLCVCAEWRGTVIVCVVIRAVRVRVMVRVPSARAPAGVGTTRGVVCVALRVCSVSFRHLCCQWGRRRANVLVLLWVANCAMRVVIVSAAVAIARWKCGLPTGR
jgi:hypothetical protein